MASIAPPLAEEEVGESAAVAEVRRRLAKASVSDPWGQIFRYGLLLALLFTLATLGVLLVTILADSWSVLSTRPESFLSAGLRSQPGEAGVFQGLRGTFWIGISVVMLAFPLGVGAAIYLEEYARRSWVTSFIDVNIRNLAGVPSVVYGILGFTVFVKAFEPVTGGATTIAAGVTIAVLALPIVIITSAEALRAVPSSIREAGFGVGATRWEVVRSHVLPYAAPGILTGTVLSLARSLGEAAPLILVGAVTGRLASQDGLLDLGQLDEHFTAMPIVITTWTGRPEPEFQANAAAAIMVLLVIVLVANAAAVVMRNHFEKKRKG